MALTEQQRETRRRFIGSSDVAAIVGVDPFRNAGDVFLEKTGQLEAKSTEETRRGARLESLNLDWFEERMGVLLQRDIWLDNGDAFCANLDGAVLIEDGLTDPDPSVISQGHITAVVEAKSTKWIEMWGDNISEVPLPVVVQVQWQIFLAGTGCRRGYAPVLWPKYRDFGFEIPPVIMRDDELIEQLQIEATEFLGFLRAGEMPPNATPHLESLKRIKREPESVLSLDAEQSEALMQTWARKEMYAATRKSAISDEEMCKAWIVNDLGQSEAARLINGSLVTYYEQNGARQTDENLLQNKLSYINDGIQRAIEQLKNATPGEAMATLRTLDPEAVYQQVVTQGRHRVLRMKKAKGAK